MSATVKFDPGVPPVAQKEGSCPADFVGKIEPKGIVTIAYDPKSYESDENENVEFAAVRSCHSTLPTGTTKEASANTSSTGHVVERSFTPNVSAVSYALVNPRS